MLQYLNTSQYILYGLRSEILIFLLFTKAFDLFVNVCRSNVKKNRQNENKVDFLIAHVIQTYI